MKAWKRFLVLCVLSAKKMFFVASRFGIKLWMCSCRLEKDVLWIMAKLLPGSFFPKIYFLQLNTSVLTKKRPTLSCYHVYWKTFILLYIQFRQRMFNDIRFYKWQTKLVLWSMQKRLQIVFARLPLKMAKKRLFRSLGPFFNFLIAYLYWQLAFQ